MNDRLYRIYLQLYDELFAGERCTRGESAVADTAAFEDVVRYVTGLTRPI
ncbi:hypothetical protein [Mycolicibacterium sediminis]|nr:hypothetical protein [Mycolicibacterium sediminis]